MISKLFLIVVIVVLVLIIFTLIAVGYIQNYLFAYDFLPGSWIDADGNIVVLEYAESGDIRISFGTQIGHDEYEVASGEYEFGMSKSWFKPEYTAKFGDNLRIEIIPVDKNIRFYKKDKLIGSFYPVKSL